MLAYVFPRHKQERRLHHSALAHMSNTSKMEVGLSKESLVVICETDVNSISGSLIVIGQEVLIAYVLLCIILRDRIRWRQVVRLKTAKEVMTF